MRYIGFRRKLGNIRHKEKRRFGKDVCKYHPMNNRFCVFTRDYRVVNFYELLDYENWKDFPVMEVKRAYFVSHLYLIDYPVTHIRLDMGSQLFKYTDDGREKFGKKEIEKRC